MPLGSKQTTSTELWVPIINKKTGEAYKGLEKCASLERLDKEEKVLSDLLDEKLNAWIDQDPQKREEELRDYNKGFKYQHTDGYSYKIVQNNQGEHQLSRSKGFGGAGGYRKGGASYIHLRTTVAKICRVEEIAPIINDQQDNDNWEIMQLQADSKGDKFLLLNKKPYTPSAGDTASASSKETKTENSESETETETESTE